MRTCIRDCVVGPFAAIGLRQADRHVSNRACRPSTAIRLRLVSPSGAFPPQSPCFSHREICEAVNQETMIAWSTGAAAWLLRPQRNPPRYHMLSLYCRRRQPEMLPIPAHLFDSLQLLALRHIRRRRASVINISTTLSDSRSGLPIAKGP